MRPENPRSGGIYKIPIVHSLGILQVQCRDSLLLLFVGILVLLNKDKERGQAALMVWVPQESLDIGKRKIDKLPREPSLLGNRDSEKFVPFTVFPGTKFEKSSVRFCPSMTGKPTEFALDISGALFNKTHGVHS